MGVFIKIKCNKIFPRTHVGFATIEKHLGHSKIVDICGCVGLGMVSFFTTFNLINHPLDKYENDFSTYTTGIK